MVDDSVQKEIEANERRVREESDIGIDSDIVEQENDGSFVGDKIVDPIFGGDDDLIDQQPREDEHEYRHTDTE